MRAEPVLLCEPLTCKGCHSPLVGRLLQNPFYTKTQ